jgi:hypothetical protein
MEGDRLLLSHCDPAVSLALKLQAGAFMGSLIIIVAVIHLF